MFFEAVAPNSVGVSAENLSCTKKFTKQGVHHSRFGDSFFEIFRSNIVQKTSRNIPFRLR